MEKSTRTERRERINGRDSEDGFDLMDNTAPPGAAIPLLLDNESWSFSFEPDMRYGKELLYQAFQLHAHHLHRLTLTVGADNARKNSARQDRSRARSDGGRPR